MMLHGWETCAYDHRLLPGWLATLRALDPLKAFSPLLPQTQEQQKEKPYSMAGESAVIPIFGAILKSVPWIYEFFGIDATSTNDVSRSLSAAVSDQSAKSITLLISSPGGQIDGVQELADQIYAARQVKPVTAHIQDMGASAAYWLASQANQVFANATAQVGSIGVYGVIEDSSEAALKDGYRVKVIKSGPLKGAGVPGTQITDEQMAEQQKLVDGLAEQFWGAVVRGRGDSVVKARFEEDKETHKTTVMSGGVWLAESAMDLGLIDAVKNYG